MHDPHALWRFKRIATESPPKNRTEFERDKDRILHSDAFRRLGGKTQVFLAPQNDHVRNRLSHSIEVAQIAGSIAKHLNFSQDLAEAIAFAHDLGHPPFGHAGETALNEIFSDIGGYDHNAQALRILEKLEQRYLDFEGLNLTNEMIDGIIKHNGPVTDATGAPSFKFNPVALDIFRSSAEKRGIRLDTRACIEAQAAAISDDIAYNVADLDDGVRTNFLSFDELFEQPWLAEMLEPSARESSKTKRLHDALRRLMRTMIDDVLTTSERNLSKVVNIENIRHLPAQTIHFSPEIAEREQDLKKFLRKRVYHNSRIEAELHDATDKLAAIAKTLVQNPQLLPSGWNRTKQISDKQNAEIVRDYIAGMTDQYAFNQYKNLKASNHI